MIIIVNGSPHAGKDSFCDFVCDFFNKDGFARTLSTVDFVKNVARICDWDGEKTPKNRKFLSDLKDLLTDFNDLPFRKICGTIGSLGRQANELMVPFNKRLYFVMCREPKEIQKFVEKLGAKTLLVSRPEAEIASTSNHADSGVLNYLYDTVIVNNGTLEDLKEKAKIFSDKILKGESYDGIY